MPSFYYSRLVKDQLDRMRSYQWEEFNWLKNGIYWDTGAGHPHELEGFGDQGRLEGTYARDFTTGGGGYGWRLVYWYDDYGDVHLIGILDYHGGGRWAPRWAVGGHHDLSDREWW